MKNDDGIIYMLYIIASIGFFVSAALNIYINNAVTGIVFMVLGACFLSLTSIYMVRDKESKKDLKKKK